MREVTEGTRMDEPAAGAAAPATEAEAERVLDATVAISTEVLGPGLDAVFALGSLAHGGFAPLVSDVDVALVTRERHGDLAPTIAEIGRRVAEARPGPLAERLSLFWTDWPGVRQGPRERERLPAVDRLDLLEHGRLLHGRDDRAGAARPTPQRLVAEAAQFARDRFDPGYLAALREPAALVARGPRATTKAVLFPVRFLYTLHTHRIGLNDAAAGWYRGQGAHGELTDAALAWRVRGLADPAGATALLAVHLCGLYREFCRAYQCALRPTRPDLAGWLGATADAL